MTAINAVPDEGNKYVIVSNDENERLDLTSMPGAYVVLRQLSFGETMQRQDLIMRMMMPSGPKKGKKRRGTGDDDQLRMEMANAAASQFMFSRAITDHNLAWEGPTGPVPFDFRRPAGEWINKLPPKVGKEIDKAIIEMNGLDDEGDEAEEDFQ